MARRGEQAISDEAVREKTGRSWAEWLVILDSIGAAALGHTETARRLEREHGVSGWWAQAVTVRYEQERGLRQVGQTAKGFAVSVQRTFSEPPEAIFAALAGPRGFATWLPGSPEQPVSEGDSLTLEDGTRCTVRALRPRALRLVWEPAAGGRSTVELALAPGAGGKTAARIQHEGMASAEEREERRALWTRALQALGSALGGGR